MRAIKKMDISSLLELLSRQGTVYVPVREEDGLVSFSPWSPGAEIAWDAGNSLVPPKQLLFPQTETIYRYRVDGLNVSLDELALDDIAPPQVLVGIRPCDVKSLEVLDAVFLTAGYVDTFYQARRNRTLVVAQACTKTQPTCFCDSMGVSPVEALGADIVLYDLGEEMGVVVQTEKGAQALAGAERLGQEKEVPLPKAPECRLSANVDGLAERLKGHFYDPVWDELYRKCLGCGICTYLCPTCHCFDIDRENRGQNGWEYRAWDSCMYSQYTLMAGGHNPRPTKKERVRNRFLHKLQYIPERYGILGCVGCGRCLAKCPVNMDITRIITRLQEVAAGE
ncbi:MAG: 4Fe-4S dicluster domain-containing protein [Clostridia bacterium]|nr:4Fe-4S dicluster domain-containing protein [Clostridia bacterium]